MATTIFWVIWFKDDIMREINNLMEIIKEFPVATILIFFVMMTLMISASVPSAIPQIAGSYLFVHAFGFLYGFLIMVVVDYFSMLIGWIPPFLFARYLLKSWVNDYTSNKPKLIALSRALSKNAKKLVALMRCWALTPYVVFNIVCGITDMSLLDYCIGNLAIIFWDASYIYICCSVSKMTSGIGITYAISLVIVIGVSYYIYRVAQSEADKIMEERRTSIIIRKSRLSDLEATVRLTSPKKQ